LKRILKEPLLHFLLLGVAIFVAYCFVSKRTGDRSEPAKIVITLRQIEHLATAFTRTWQRPPSAEELEGLVRDRVREEVYYREAMALGLDKEDTIIRRRLRQKMEFISDDIAVQTEPTAVELNAYLRAHPDSFRVEPRFTFQHVYLNPEKHGENLTRDAARLLAQLQEAGDRSDPAALGDSFLLEHKFDAVPGGEVAKQFGEKFAAKLAKLPPGQWQGPIESGYGVHLVLVNERMEARPPVLAEVRDVVRSEWDKSRRLEMNEKFYQELRKRYTVTIEGLEPKKMAVAK